MLRREKVICQLWLWIHRKTSKSHKVALKVSLKLKIASQRRWSFKMHEHGIKADVSRPISCSASVFGGIHAWYWLLQRNVSFQKRHIGACAATQKTMPYVVHSKPITSRTTCTKKKKKTPAHTNTLFIHTCNAIYSMHIHTKINKPSLQNQQIHNFCSGVASTENRTREQTSSEEWKEGFLVSGLKREQDDWKKWRQSWRRRLHDDICVPTEQTVCKERRNLWSKCPEKHSWSNKRLKSETEKMREKRVTETSKRTEMTRKSKSVTVKYFDGFKGNVIWPKKQM